MCTEHSTPRCESQMTQGATNVLYMENGECLTKLCVIRFTSMSETVLYKIIHETPLLVSEFTGLVVFCIYIFIFVSFSFVVAFLILLFI